MGKLSALQTKMFTAKQFALQTKMCAENFTGAKSSIKMFFLTLKYEKN
jgi:hypothetical protein